MRTVKPSVPDTLDVEKLLHELTVLQVELEAPLREVLPYPGSSDREKTQVSFPFPGDDTV